MRILSLFREAGKALTARRRDAALARQELAAIVASSDDAIIGKDLQGVITSWNTGAEELFGYTASEAVGRSIRMVIPLDRQAEEDAVIAQVRAGRRVDHFDTLRLRKDGTTVEVSISVSPIRDASGAIVGAAKIARDITERRRVERVREELLVREQAARAEAVAARDRLAFLAGASVALASTLDYAQTLERAAHLPLPRLGDYCVIVLTDEDGAPQVAAVGHVDRGRERLVRQAIRPESIEPPVVRIAPDLRPVARLAVPLSALGRTFGLLFFGTTADGSAREYDEADIALTEEFGRRAAAAIENARLFHETDELNRLKDEFLATLSHELRTPLSAIIGWSRLLATGQLEPSARQRAIEAIHRNAQAQARIVDDILDVAGGMAGNLRLELGEADLAEIARRGVDAVAPGASAKHIALTLDASEPLRITGDPARLQQVVWNLLSNAVKFTPSGGHVRVAVHADHGEAELAVTDSGIGIAPEFLPHVFEKFRQADASFTREYGGLGLGLAIARHLVELHGGTIAVRSDGVGQGATFVVRLPLAVAESAAS